MVAFVRRHLALLVGVATLLAVAGVTLVEGRVSWVEVSRRTLAHRSAYHYEVPIVGLQVTPTVHGPSWRPVIAEHLAARGLLDPNDGPASEWDFVKGFKCGVRGWHGPMKRLCFELDCWSSEDARWVAWSARHPALAEALWPLVIDAVRRGDPGRAAVALQIGPTCTDPATLVREVEARTER